MSTILLDPHSISTMNALYDFLEWELSQTFGRNLDGLSDIISEKWVIVQILDESYFRSVFGVSLTQEYYGERYDSDYPTLAETLKEIFTESGDSALLQDR